jgi:CARDB/Bacterial pre-peptidase C-terminal domain
MSIAEQLRASARSLTLNANGAPINLQDNISQWNPRDLYSLNITSLSAVKLELGNLSGDLDIQLLNAQGESLQGSFFAGTTPELIDRDLQPGQYYVQVQQYSGDSRYDLSVNVQSYQSYRFEYYFNGKDNTSDYYTGYTYAHGGTYQVGQFYDPIEKNNTTGKNGRYFITAMTDGGDRYSTQQVFVDRYYDVDATGQSFIPVGFSQKQRAGSKGLGSEQDRINGAVSGLFGGDQWEYDAAISELSGNGLSVTEGLVAPGYILGLKYSVTNSLVATENVQVSFYLSRDEAIAPDDYLLTQSTIASFYRNSTKTDTIQITLPNSQNNFWDGPGTYYLGMIIDGDNLIKEANETNNLNLGIGKDVTAIDVQEFNSTPAFLVSPAVGHAQKSGQIEIDALLNSTGAYWDTSQNGGFIPFSFYRTGAKDYVEDTSTELTEPIKANVRQVMETIERYINVHFIETADNEYVPLRYLFAKDTRGDSYAYAFYPDSNIGGDVHLSDRWESDAKNSFGQGPGNHGYMTLLHETLHALGLKHPGNYDVGGNGTEGPYLLPANDNTSNTIMSYNTLGSSPITPMEYDIRALQYLYGAKRQNSNATTYQFTTVHSYQVASEIFGLAETPIKQTLWDSQGIDTLDLSQLATVDRGYSINLNGGGWITTQIDRDRQIYYAQQNRMPYYATPFGTAIAYSTVLENVITSKSDDQMIANSANNRFQGYDPGQDGGNDRLEGTDRSDILDLANYRLDQIQARLEGEDLLLHLPKGSIRIVNYYASTSRIQIYLNQASYAYTISAGWNKIP